MDLTARLTIDRWGVDMQTGALDVAVVLTDVPAVVTASEGLYRRRPSSDSGWQWVSRTAERGTTYTLVVDELADVLDELVREHPTIGVLADVVWGIPPRPDWEALGWTDAADFDRARAATKEVMDLLDPVDQATVRAAAGPAPAPHLYTVAVWEARHALVEAAYHAAIERDAVSRSDAHDPADVELSTGLVTELDVIDHEPIYDGSDPLEGT